MYMKASENVIDLATKWVERILEDKTKTKEERDNHFVTGPMGFEASFRSWDEKWNSQSEMVREKVLPHWKFTL